MTLILNPIAPSKDVCYHCDIISHDKARGEKGLNVLFRSERLKIHIELWVALIEIAHHVTYLYKDFGMHTGPIKNGKVPSLFTPVANLGLGRNHCATFEAN